MDAIIETLHHFWLALQQGQVPPSGYWNYLLLMVLIIIQGPIMTMLGGAAASVGLLNPALVFIAAITGNLCADIFWYAVGRGKRLGRLADWREKRPQRLEGLRRGMQAKAIPFLLMAKLSLGMAVPALIAAGLARVPWRRWFPAVFSGEIVWTGSLLLIGYYATESLKQAEQVVLYLSLVVSLMLLLMVLIFVSRTLRAYEQVGEL
jgi:membrane protein DedA with SNARE-associated domain